MSADLYITMQGDAWDSIAFRLWGDERHFMALSRPIRIIWTRRFFRPE
jgi:hypothetical protein